jgi:hypothetical protein
MLGMFEYIGAFNNDGIKYRFKLGNASCRLAPVTTSGSGTPPPSVSIWCLLPFFSPAVGVSPRRFLRQRRFGHAAVSTQPCPVDAPLLRHNLQALQPKDPERILFHTKTGSNGVWRLKSRTLLAMLSIECLCGERKNCFKNPA